MPNRPHTPLKSLLARGLLALPLAASLFAMAPAARAEEKLDSTRLISIGGDLTEIIYALGEDKHLIARDTTSLFPEQALKLPDVGYMRALSPENILAMNPTAIVAVEGSGPPEALTVLRSASVPFETVPNAYTRDGILAKIDKVGTLLGVEAKASELHRQVANDLDAAIADAAKHPEGERKRVLFIGTFPGYTPLTDEAIIEAKPDVILMMNRGDGAGTKNEDLLKQPALALTPAAKNNAIIRMDGLHLLGFGPRTASAVRELTTAIYGG
jgi:iron complex transport system substrate-binding protein